MRNQKIQDYFPSFLLTIPLAFILNAANHYFGLLDWPLLVAPLLTYFLIAIPVYYLFKWIFRSAKKATVFTSVLLILFYFFSAIHQWIKESIVEKASRYSVLLPLVIVLLIVLFAYLLKSKKPFVKTARAINLIFLLLVVSGASMLCINYFTHKELSNDQSGEQQKIAENFKPCDSCAHPDIYYILLDGYTNSTTLKKEFNYDNSEIETFLTQRGFHIIEGSRSNYNFTHMSMASTFNLDYLQNLDNRKNFYTKEFLQSYYTIYRNEWSRILKRQGYIIKNYSIFDMAADKSRVEPFLSELNYRSVPGQTFFNKLNRDIGWKLRQYFDSKGISASEQNYIDQNIKRINQTVDGVMQEANNTDKVPKFVYAHLILPHETFYFDSAGNRLPVLYTLRTPLNKKDYVNQLVYTNKFIVKKLVDEIQSKTQRKSIIIIQGDHGYRNYPGDKINLEFENFNAVYFPDSNYTAFQHTASSVNTFRIVASQYFHYNLPILKDSIINLMKIRTQ